MLGPFGSKREDPGGDEPARTPPAGLGLSYRGHGLALPRISRQGIRHMDSTVRISWTECNGEAGVDRWSTMSIASWAGCGRTPPRAGEGDFEGFKAAIDHNVSKAVRRLSERVEPAGALAVGQAAGVHPLVEAS